MSSAPHILPSIPKSATASQAVRRKALPYEPVCALFRRYLHGEKLKFTPERAMILDAVLKQDGLFDPDHLAGELKTLGHRASRATVYRTLGHLHDAGILKQVFFDNRQSYYEVIAGRRTHDYLICVETGEVIEFDSDKLRHLRDAICAEHGYDPLGHQFHIFGLSPRARNVGGGAGPESNVSAQGDEGGEREHEDAALDPPERPTPPADRRPRQQAGR